jgi:hypothetical protein
MIVKNSICLVLFGGGEVNREVIKRGSIAHNFYPFKKCPQ